MFDYRSLWIAWIVWIGHININCYSVIIIQYDIHYFYVQSTYKRNQLGLYTFIMCSINIIQCYQSLHSTLHNTNSAENRIDGTSLSTWILGSDWRGYGSFLLALIESCSAIEYALAKQRSCVTEYGTNALHEHHSWSWDVIVEMQQIESCCGA